MARDIVIVGAGGFGREVEWLINRINNVEKKYNVLGFADDNKEVGEQISNLKVIYKINDLKNIDKEIDVVIAIANSKARKEIVQRLRQNSKIKFPNIIDPAAIIDSNLIKGKGNVLCAGVIATVDIEINNFNIIDVDSTIGHDVKMKDYITLYPSVNVSGNVLINDCVEVGTGTQIIQGKTIGENVIIGAGSVVIRDIESNVTAVGVPTRILQK